MHSENEQERDGSEWRHTVCDRHVCQMETQLNGVTGDII